jgi:hypothetical protein
MGIKLFIGKPENNKDMAERKDTSKWNVNVIIRFKEIVSVAGGAKKQRRLHRIPQPA